MNTIVSHKSWDCTLVNNPLGQHYIPEMLLKHFCDDDGYLWVGDRQKGRVWKSKPRQAFKIKHLYTNFSVDAKTNNLGHKSYEYEKALGVIETRAAPILESIIEQVRRKKTPQFSYEQETVLKHFMFAIARRTPESQKRLVSTKDFEDMYYEVAEEHATKQGYPLPDKETLYKDLQTVREIKHAKHNVDARYAAGNHPRMQETEKKFCDETGLAFFCIGTPKRSFVIGSHGISILQFAQGEEHGCLPISHDICVTPTPHPNETTLHFLGHGNKHDRFIKKFNKSTAVRSQQIAGRSKSLINSLMQFRD